MVTRKPGAPRELTRWIGRLLADPDLQRMGHDQRAADLNLGLGWLYYGLARVLRPRRVVVIGSYRGFVPLVLARGLQDNLEGGEVVFVDPSLVDDFWKDGAAVKRHFRRFGLDNVRHYRLTTQEFVETDAWRELGDVSLLFVDGYHTESQARFDYRAFEGKLAPEGLALFHDSVGVRPSRIYGDDKAYETTVRYFVDELKRDPGLQVLDLPFGAGLTIVRKIASAAAPHGGSRARLSPRRRSPRRSGRRPPPGRRRG
jgi:predicted O-methyltransferase YrrM